LSPPSPHVDAAKIRVVALLSTAARSFPTISSQEEWEQHGEMIIRTTSRLCIAGATEKKGRKGVDNCPVGGQQLNISTRY
jgi:hypothetical protein